MTRPERDLAVRLRYFKPASPCTCHVS